MTIRHIDVPAGRRACPECCVRYFVDEDDWRPDYPTTITLPGRGCLFCTNGTVPEDRTYGIGPNTTFTVADVLAAKNR